jgi:chitinase
MLLISRTDVWVMLTIVRYRRVNSLKALNPRLKTLLAVGGLSAGTTAMTVMLSAASNRQQFINSSIGFLRAKSFDGLDLDFEYPGNGNSPSSDKQLFALLVQVCRAVTDLKSLRSSRYRHILESELCDRSYEILFILFSRLI